jgi:hypothetical protein
MCRAGNCRNNSGITAAAARIQGKLVSNGCQIKISLGEFEVTKLTNWKAWPERPMSHKSNGVKMSMMEVALVIIRV